MFLDGRFDYKPSNDKAFDAMLNPDAGLLKAGFGILRGKLNVISLRRLLKRSAKLPLERFKE